MKLVEWSLEQIEGVLGERERAPWMKQWLNVHAKSAASKEFGSGAAGEREDAPAPGAPAGTKPEALSSVLPPPVAGEWRGSFSRASPQSREAAAPV